MDQIYFWRLGANSDMQNLLAIIQSRFDGFDAKLEPDFTPAIV
jgi:hypothetical protein